MSKRSRNKQDDPNRPAAEPEPKALDNATADGGISAPQQLPFDMTQHVEIPQDTTISAFLSANDLDKDHPIREPMECPAAQLSVKGNRRYQIARILAQGGMGVVCEARDMTCDRVVAMKLMPTGGKKSDVDNDLFVREARLTAQLEHPNIVPVHELGEDDNDNSFYTMKFVRGVTLTEILMHIRNGRRDVINEYSLSDLLTIFQKMCDAVAFSHSKGIVHCDLKPGNVMIGDYGEVLVLDWGLARSVWKDGDPEPKPSRKKPIRFDEVDIDQTVSELPTSAIHTDSLGTGLKSGSGKIVGTPSFMSPEQALGRGRDLDHRSDIYSLGAILYSILTLRVPIDGENIREVLKKIIHGEIVPPIEYNLLKSGESFHLMHLPDGQVPQVLSDIVMKAMATDPDARYQNVKLLQADIEAYQSGKVWHLVLDEDFVSKDVFASRWKVMGGECEITDRGLRIHSGEPQVVVLKRNLPLEVRVEMECWQDGGYLNDIACLINAVPSGSNWDISVSGYAFKLGAYTNTYNVLTRCDRKIWSAPAAPLESGRVFRVVAERVGGRLRMVVDNREIFSVVDSEPLTGASRTAVALLGWIADTTFRRVRVFTLGTPWRTDTLDMAERQLQKGHFETAMHLYEEVRDSFPDAERLDAANQGYKIAAARQEMKDMLPKWKAKLKKVWPEVELDLKLDYRGLAMEIPSGDITDLEPIRGIPLSALSCSRNRIKSLEPLRGMPLTMLYCAANEIEDLEPLRGMPLSTLDFSVNQVRSMDSLLGMRIAWLNCGDNPIEGGLKPLRGMPLTWLNCCQCGVTDIGPLENMPLTMLFCDANEIEDLTPLRSLPLQEVSFSANKVRHLRALEGLQLNDINCASNAIEDLEPLRGMPLSTLRCQCNRIRSLEPLKEMGLSTLMCGGNRLKSVDPFRIKPPKNFWFDCDTIPSEELEWLRQAWSRDFRFAHYAKEVGVLLALRREDPEALLKLASEFQGRKFLFVPRFERWEDAKVISEKMGGHLVTITSAAENEYLLSFFPYGCSWFWIGLQTVDGVPEWVTGEDVAFRCFIDDIQEKMEGPKIFRGGNWFYDLVPDARNCFVIEWET